MKSSTEVGSTAENDPDNGTWGTCALARLLESRSRGRRDAAPTTTSTPRRAGPPRRRRKQVKLNDGAVIAFARFQIDRR